MSSRDEQTPPTSEYLGPLATSGDAELLGILLSLQSAGGKDQILLLSDSQSSITKVTKLVTGAQSTHSSIKTAIKRLLTIRGENSLDTGIAWVRSHIGVTGNEIADEACARRSFTGQLLSEPQIATEAGIRQTHKQARATWRARATTGLERLTQWGRQALSAYTQTRTNRVPMKACLYKIGTADDPRCPACSHPTQDGDHIVFHCPALRAQRDRLIGTRGGDSWSHLDHPLLIKLTPEDNELQDGTELFCKAVFDVLA